jgi:hypothetical protein
MGGRVEAPASKATPVVQLLLDRTGALQTPGNLMNLFAPLYKEFGARIHTNSWGSTHNPARPFAQLAYDVPAHNIDQFVWKIRDMVILFSAGNDGSDADKNGVNHGPEIGPQASAKNCITVGATESLRETVWFGIQQGGDRQLQTIPWRTMRRAWRRSVAVVPQLRGGSSRMWSRQALLGLVRGASIENWLV